MRVVLFLIFLLMLPFVDLWLLMEVASVIGFWQTIAIILATGIIGVNVVRREAGFVLEKLRTSVTAEEMSRNFLEAALVLFAVLLLLSPGLITDSMGVAITFRPLRERLIAYLARKFKEKGNFQIEIINL